MRGKQMPQFEETAEAVAHFQKDRPLAVLLLETGGDRGDPARKLRAGHKRKKLHHLHGAVQRVEQVVPVRCAGQVGIGKPPLQLPDRPRHLLPVVGRDRHKAEEGERGAHRRRRPGGRRAARPRLTARVPYQIRRRFVPLRIQAPERIEAVVDGA